jgi:hypothetical protein
LDASIYNKEARPQPWDTHVERVELGAQCTPDGDRAVEAAVGGRSGGVVSGGKGTSVRSEEELTGPLYEEIGR